MKTTEIRAKSDDELKQLLLDMRRTQFNLRMQAGMGQPARANEIREARKDIARIKTVQEERRRGVSA
tara:strand:+ start:295 stop:495 length:201 start_codon:yes stop_codon:yes gene_type:complete